MGDFIQAARLPVIQNEASPAMQDLIKRIGAEHVERRLKIETDHAAQLFGQGLVFFNLENWYSAPLIIGSALKLSGLYSRARRNADKVVIRRNTLTFERLPRAFDNFTILHLSDLHVDISEGAMQHLVNIVGDLQYDICVLTGDYRGKTYGPFEKSIKGLKELRTRLKEPIYDGVDAPPTAWMCQSGGVEHHLREASVSEVIIIGLDIAKHVFHAHGADERGRAVFSKRISRGKLLDFFAAQPRCMVALEACGGAHHWARQLTQLGHKVRLIPPAYVKPFVKRQKNDAIDAEAICEAAQRPSMRFVAVKSEQQQAAGLVFRTRDLLVRQRTQLINAIRGHLTEYGWVAPKGPSHVAMLADLIEEEEMVNSLPEAARAMFRVMLDLLAGLNSKIADLDKEIARRAREDEVSRRLMTVPGIGPISATAIAALAPPAETFAKGRDFAAWLGLTPLQRSTGGKQKLGATSKMGERTLRRLLIIGSSAVVKQASKRGAPRGSWLEQMLARKPRMLVTVALANKMARIVWALLVKQENYRAPVAAKA
jgi:transposase